MVKEVKKQMGGQTLTAAQLEKLKEKAKEMVKQSGAGYTSDLAGSAGLVALRGTYPKIDKYNECCTPDVVTGNFDSISGILKGGARKRRTKQQKRKLSKKSKSNSKKMMKKTMKKSKKGGKKQKGGVLPHVDPKNSKFGCRQPTWDPECK